MGRQHSYRATVRWTGNTGSGTSGYRGYGRAHDILGDGKPTLRGSADPAFLGDPGCWNPEEFLLVSRSQCHMLTYLSVCARDGVRITAYEDVATGVMEEAAGRSGRFAEVVLNPVVTVADAAMAERARSAHHDAHQTCFIANSVNFPVHHRPTIRVG
ncbi:OsmC family protein [Streptomyces violaceusniger]|uniref:OsmC family protein n=1 Tax=Streptomyces violaceusniger (strain Tu 4113) TaxID=653045 RepID=G2NW28_STRV4|nr:OsmC family protein [Streptomyces violaceusniger]AEM86488.1 OsmC family protein [Streptomyces violaceusniger Tu 4113]